MVRESDKRVLFAVSLPLIIFFFTGCGHNGMDSGTDAYFSMLEPNIRSLNSRLQSHYEAVTEILGSAEERTTGFERTSSKIQVDFKPGLLSDAEWEAIHTEQEYYGQEMHRILNDLGDTVTMIGECRMMMGGMMFGPEDIEKECPCALYMDTSLEELDRHLAQMLDWMDQGDMPGMWEEMEEHWGQMGFHIREMASHMQKTYGSHGGMMGMM